MTEVLFNLIAIEQLVKVQLLERVASPAAFEFFVKAVASSLNGEAEFLEALAGC
ncbi:hypothetical protein [Burkholderia orbicola]|uniref:hypothetical protein n=1 Tax=Burkholderia orbicola TaxID=2978683 RepID=UPI002650DC4E|nr:hypothetical protein [Burkholderia orbicola]MDN7535465.1 hypothetical protein [Burkholderia orbicola]